MKARLLIDMTGDDGVCPASGRRLTSPRPAGTIIDHPEAFRLVQQGCAEAADDECRDAAGMTLEEQVKARIHYDMVSQGIAPEDYEAYQAGVMRGYDRNGDWIPGPNYDVWAAEQDEEEEDDD